METCCARILIRFVAAAAVAVIAAAPAHAIDKCKVKVDKKTGVILVDAGGVGGPLTWGDEPGSETNSFFNAGTCVAGDKARKCQLADPATLASKTAPSGCTLYLADTVQDCSAWIPGCSPGARDDTGVVLKDANGALIGNIMDQGAQSVIRKHGGDAISLPIALDGLGFSSNGNLHYLSNDCTGPPLGLVNDGVIQPTVVFGTTGYIQPSTGSSQFVSSYVQFLSFTTSQAACDSYWGPGLSTHVAPNGCCFLAGFSSTFGTPPTIDLSVFVPPFVAEID